MTGHEPLWARFVRAAVTSAPAAGPEPTAEAPPVTPPATPPARARAHRRPRLPAPLRAHPDVQPAPPARRADLRLVPAALLAWAGALYATHVPWPLAPLSAGAGWLVLLAVSLRGGPGRRRLPGRLLAPLLLGLLGVTTVITAVALVQADRHESGLAGVVRGTGAVPVRLEIRSAPHPGPALHGGVSFQALLLGAAVAPGPEGWRQGTLPLRVIAGPAWADLPVGAVASTVARVAATAAGERAVGVVYPVTDPLRLTLPAPTPVDRVRVAWREASGQAWGGRSPDAATLLPGMVAGDRTGLSPTIAAALQTAGLSHLTAVSGANCTLVLTLLVVALRSCHLPRAPTTAGSLLGLAGFVLVVGPDPSVLRAALMGGIGGVALLGGRPRRAGVLLAVCVWALLLSDPWLASDFAFLLSVAATLGLVLVGARLARWLGRWMPPWCAQLLAIALVAQACCAPLLVLLAPRLTLYAVPANLLVAPVVPAVTLLGTLGLAVAVACPPAGFLCALVSGAGSWWVATVATVTAALPGASLPWPAGGGGALLLVAVQAVAVAVIAAVLHRRQVLRRLSTARAGLRPGWEVLLRWPALTLLAAGLAAALTWAVTS